VFLFRERSEFPCPLRQDERIRVLEDDTRYHSVNKWSFVGCTGILQMAAIKVSRAKNFPMR